MAELTLQDQKLWIDGFDFTGIMNAMQIEATAEPKDKTNFGSAGARQRLPGPDDFTMAHEGYYDADPFDAALFTRLGQAGPVLMSVGGQSGTEGDIGYSGEVMLSDYGPGAPFGEVFAFGLSAEGRAGIGLARSTILRNGAETVSGTGTGRQVGAVAADDSMAAALHVLAVSGTAPTLDVIVESDDNAGFTTATTRMTFTQQVGVDAERQVFDGPETDDWWRASWTIGGTTPSFTFVLLLGQAARK